MKNKIFAILLLLSFLVVLSHEMIPHHHHHEYEADNVFDEQNLDDSFSEKSSSEGHHHPFPLHHHFSATSDFVYARTNIQDTNSVNKFSPLLVVSVVLQIDFFEPPCLSTNPSKDKPFFISSVFHPAAKALRGPPAIV